ncbi:MAG TPA: outer membrane beta-barrel protein [Chitinophagaceae bacterium]|nr:outer membrane beta-barrel protein [Chitinophagaceae bacterium]
MQHLENDMDDLFQRAAENYPLQEGKSDWENIAKRISDNTNSPEVIAPLQNNKNKKFIVLTLLLFTLVAGWLIFQNTRTGTNNNSNKTELVKKSEANPNSEVDNDNPVISSEEHGSNINDKNNIDDKNKSAIRPSYKSSSHINSSVSNGSFFFDNSNTTQTRKGVVNEDAIEENSYSNNYFYLPPTGIEESTGISEFNKSSFENLISATLNENPDLSGKNKKQALNIKQKNKGIYIGVVAGPDFSKVQSGSFANTGFDAGVLLGFNINRKFSFETGIMWTKKIYESEGKNFSMDKVRSTMPVGMEIDNLTSRSSFIEIPVKGKYNFAIKNKSDLFVSGGVSAYIMTKEKNAYNVSLNGNREKLLGVYEKDNYCMPAVANVSIGYEHSVSKSLDIRIEPFLKIPLQGMGVGSLPVTSAGLQLGIISRLRQ